MQSEKVVQTRDKTQRCCTHVFEDEGGDIGSAPQRSGVSRTTSHLDWDEWPVKTGAGVDLRHAPAVR